MGEKGAKLSRESITSAEFIQKRLSEIGNIRVKKMFGASVDQNFKKQEIKYEKR